MYTVTDFLNEPSIANRDAKTIVVEGLRDFIKLWELFQNDERYEEGNIDEFVVDSNYTRVQDKVDGSLWKLFSVLNRRQLSMLGRIYDVDDRLKEAYEWLSHTVNAGETYELYQIEDKMLNPLRVVLREAERFPQKSISKSVLRAKIKHIARNSMKRLLRNRYR